MKKTILSLLFCPLVLAACGGSGGSSDPTPAPTPVPPKSAALLTAQSLTERYATTADTAVTAMPTVGTATYAGAAVFGRDTAMDALLKAPTMTADVAMTADFKSGTVTGALDNFRNAQNDAIAGKLNMNDAKIAANVVGGDLSGTVGGKTVDAQMLGHFVGDSANAVKGTIADGTGAAGSFNGAFVAAR